MIILYALIFLYKLKYHERFILLYKYKYSQGCWRTIIIFFLSLTNAQHRTIAFRRPNFTLLVIHL